MNQYALIVGLIAVVGILAITRLGDGVKVLLTRAANTVCNAGGGDCSSGASTAPASPALSAPINTALPIITGTANPGNVLTASTGSWSANPAPPSYSYQWQRGTTNIGGATFSAYSVVAADVGQTLRVIVTATNSVGSGTATSAATTTVPTVAIVNNAGVMRWADGTVAANCKAYLNPPSNYAPGNTSGAYDLNPGTAIVSYCDQTSDGGGWTLIHKNDRSNANDRTDAGTNVSGLQTTTLDSVAMLPAATIDALDSGGEWRAFGSGGEKMYWQTTPGTFRYRTIFTGSIPGGSLSYKFAYGNSYITGGTWSYLANDHGTIVCALASCNGTDPGHFIPSRFCCTASPPANGNDKGFWWNGTTYPARYTGGTAWVR